MLANCKSCGTPLAAFSFGAASDQCEACRNAQSPIVRSIVPKADDMGGAPSGSFPSADRSMAASPRPQWQSATNLLILINVVVFVVMVIKDPSALTAPTNEQLIRWGADFGPLTLDHDFWRLITSGFLHIGIIHIAVNMWSLWVLGRMAEKFVGPASLVAIYLLTGIGASMASLAWDSVRVSAGASGPIFGFIGAMIGVLYFAKSRLDPVQRKSLLGYVVRIALINLFIGLKAGIDNMAHAGGLVTGIAVGSLLVFTAKPDAHERAAARRNVFLATFAVLALLFVPLRAAKQDVVDVYHAETALEKKDYTGAIAEFRKYSSTHPQDAFGHTNLGYALQKAQRNKEAAEEYRRALSLDRDQHAASVNLGIIYVAEGKPEEALPLFSGHIDKIVADAECYRSFGEALLQTGDQAGAEAMFHKAIEADAKDAQSHADLAHLLTMQKKFDEASAQNKIADDLRKKATSQEK